MVFRESRRIKGLIGGMPCAHESTFPEDGPDSTRCLAGLLRFVRGPALLFCLLTWFGCGLTLDSYAGALRGGGPSLFPQNQCHIRPQDQIWLVSTRHLGKRPDSQTHCSPRLCYFRFRCKQGWTKASEREFFAASDPCRVTTVYVHGNRMTGRWVEDRGFKIYCQLKCDLREDQPIRYVIWSWPSQPLARRSALVRDVRVKARRTALQSYYLAQWLSRLQPELRVSLVGYSFGSRTILGAVHILGGGKLGGRSLPHATGECDCYVRPRVALMATAAQADWILPGNRYGCAVRQMDRGLIFYNSDDPILGRYEGLMREATGPALGKVGVVCSNRLGEDACKLKVFDATSIVGPHHMFTKYYDSESVMCQIREYALWRDVD